MNNCMLVEDTLHTLAKTPVICVSIFKAYTYYDSNVEKWHKSLGTALTTYHGHTTWTILQWFSRTQSPMLILSTIHHFVRTLFIACRLTTPAQIVFGKPDPTKPAADSFSILKTIRAGVGWAWLERLASHARLDHEAFNLFSSKPLRVSQVQSSLRHPRSTPLRNEFNSGNLSQLFTKISTNEK